VTTLKITQRRSRNGSDKRQADTLRSLGLRRIGQTVERSDSPQTRGMIAKVRHLVEVSENGNA
jgi:large subunit ribosomal protein L30